MSSQPPLFPDFASDPTGTSAFPLAVIELGTSAIRMAIGMTDGTNGVQSIEQLVQGISLGKDTFTEGEIRRETQQQCVDVLMTYRRKLEEYQCTNPQHIRVVATSAVREAQNRMAFLDRIYTATRFNVEPIDDAEIARVTYLSMRPILQSHPDLRDATTMLMEVGGGNTDVLLLQGNNILHSQSWRLGALRLQEMLKTYKTSQTQSIAIMTGQIERVLEQMNEIVPKDRPVELMALGGDVRFAARELQRDLNESPILRLPLRELARLTREMRNLTIDQIVLKYHVELSQAETLVPALMTNVLAAQMLGVKDILVTQFNLRDALLNSLLSSSEWTEEFCEQVIHSAREFARRFHVDLTHSEHVAQLSRQLFRGLQGIHQLDLRCETILYTAALLHETGLYVSQNAYHKHSYYLISHGELFGLSDLDQQLVALVSRYHRRALPKPSHEAYARLSRNSRVTISRLAAMLRLAVSLDHGRGQRINDIECQPERQRLVISAQASFGDLSLEQQALRQESGLFRDVFGMSVLLRRAT
ncbi:MAG: exopolyphosphatase [Fuerstiella sp.]|nr:exopolyphosphatase [Fuerstiella sp.]